MYVTKQKLIGDIELELVQGQPSVSLELGYPQLSYWASVHLNELVANECNQKLQRGESIPNIYTKKASCQVLVAEDASCGQCADRVYAQIPEEVLVLNNDGGIIMVQDQDGGLIYKASVSTLGLFGKMRFAKPTIENLLYTHEGEKIYIEGIKPTDIPFDEINVWYVPRQNVETMADTDQILVSDMTLPLVINRCVQRGMQQLYGTVPDPSNDGIDIKSAVFHQQIANREQ